MATQALDSVGIGARGLGAAKLLFVIAHLLAIALAAIGIVRARPAPVATALLAWLVVYFSAMHMAFFAVFRYSLPVYVYLFCFTAAGLASLLPRPAAGLAMAAPGR